VWGYLDVCTSAMMMMMTTTNALMAPLLSSGLASSDLGFLAGPLQVVLHTLFGPNSSKMVRLHLLPPEMALCLIFTFFVIIIIIATASACLFTVNKKFSQLNSHAYFSAWLK